MFIGHFGVGLGAKAAAPKTSLGTLFLASQFIDLLWPSLLLVGVERVRIAPGITKVTPLDFEAYPFSHSLLAVIGWAVLFALTYQVIKKYPRGSVVLGLAVFSHWLLDLIVHRPDLPLLPDSNFKVGFHLWASLSGTLIVEMGIFVVGVALYVRNTTAKDAVGKWTFWSLIVFLVLVYLSNLFGPPPPNVSALAWVGQSQWLLVLWGYWVDRHRQSLTTEITSHHGEPMEAYKLFNFDHPYTAPRKFSIGPFTIEVNATHCENLKLLRRHARHTLTLDDKLKPIIVWEDKVRGETAETAIAYINNKDISPSVLYPESVKYQNIDDLCLLLTFLSGRRVYLENELGDDHSRHYVDPVVNRTFYQWPGDIWENIGKISELGLTPQFYNIANVTSINDLLAVAAYANAILDSICTKWCNINKMSSFGQNKLLDSLRKEIITFAEQTVKASTALFVDRLQEQDIQTRIIDDIKARIDYIKGPSAIYKMKEFLIFHGLYPSDEQPEHKDRLKWINTIRNKFVHDGDVPTDKNYSWENMAEITVNITYLILSISQYYFATQVLGIQHEHSVQQEKENIVGYFKTGIFRGKKVFDETYAEYMVRLESEWTEVKHIREATKPWEPME